MKRALWIFLQFWEKDGPFGQNLDIWREKRSYYSYLKFRRSHGWVGIRVKRGEQGFYILVLLYLYDSKPYTGLSASQTSWKNLVFVCEMTLSCLWEKMGRMRAEMRENKMFYFLELSGFGWAASKSLVILMDIMHFPKLLQNWGFPEYQCYPPCWAENDISIFQLC